MLVALAKHVHDDVGVQQERLHLLRNCFSKRASDSWRSFLTHAAAPALSSGWSFVLPCAGCLEDRLFLARDQERLADRFRDEAAAIPLLD
jgi:hypothetical protein